MRKAKNIFFVILALYPFFNSYSQEQPTVNVDSLRDVFYTTESDSLKLAIAYYFIFDYQISDPDSAYELAQYAEDLATKRRDTLYLSALSEYLGILSTYRGEHYKALEYNLDALKYSRQMGDEAGVARALNNLGESYYELDLYGEAYDYYNQSLNKSLEIKDSLSAAVATYNVGRVLKSMGQLQKAKEFILEARNLSERIGDKEGIPYALNDLGEIYILEDRPELALETLKEALELCESFDNNIEIYILTPEVLNNIARAHRISGAYDSSLTYYNRAIKYYENLGNEGGIAETLLGQGKTLIKSNQLDEAARHLNKGLTIAKDANNKGVALQIYEELSRLYEIRNDFQRSLEFYKKFKNLSDSVFSEKKSEQFAQLQVQYETSQKDMEIALLNEREAQRATQLENEEFLRNILVVILAFTGVLLVTLYRSGARRKKINELLVVHQKEIEAQSREMESLLKLKDKFFSILSHDLRSPINALVGILDMVDEGHLTQEELVQLTKSLRIRLNNTRKLLDNLLDWAMLQMNEIEIKKESVPLKDVVQENLAFFREINDKQISFFDHVTNEVVMADRNMLDLIIRNLISNSIKFTKQKGIVEVFVEDGNTDWIVCIKDNGVGMTPEEVNKVFDKSLIYTTPGTSNEKGTGLGLKLCKEFVNRMNGKIWVESEEGKGSTFKFTVKKEESTG
ncbi:MAG: tetratricopeptide repeat-containing sensor histidine kinase [Fulvivirga sp.]|nr:tetratricopeptide repeat-containing sensor histidine kinase [Fulvivirga sp.]